MEAKKRRYLLIAFSVLVAIGFVRVGSHLLILYREGDWEGFAERKTADITNGVQVAFRGVQEETLSFACRVAEDSSLRRLLSSSKASRSEIFSRLEHLSRGRDFSLELYDADLQFIGWWGRQIAPDPADLKQSAAAGPVWAISQSALYTYLTVVTPIRTEDGKFLGLVAGSRVVEVNYPLNNRFLTSGGIAAEFSKKFGTNILLEFGEDAEPTNDGRVISTVLLGLDGKKLGMAYVDWPSRSAYLQDIEISSRRLISALAAVIPILIILAYWSDLRRLRPFLQGVIGIIILWGTRYLWLALDFPSGLLRGEIFDPTFFASPFGFGAARSIGELLITSLFLFFSVLFLLTLLPRSDQNVRRRSDRDQWSPSPPAGLLIAVLSTAVFMLLTRGYAEAIRSAIYDSKLQYTDPTSIILQPLVAAMLFSILLLTVSFLILGVLLFLTSMWSSSKFLAALSLSALPSWFFATLLFVGGSTLFGLVHPNPLTSGLYRLMLVVLVALFSLTLSWEGGKWVRFQPTRNLTLTMILAIVIAMPILDRKIHERDRDSLRLYAEELTRPVDTWVRVVLEETLNQIRSDEEAINYLSSEDPTVISGIAFRLWAGSLLSREGFNCAVGIVREGKILSLFNLGLRRSEAAALIIELEEYEDIRIFLIRSEKEVQAFTRYVGSAPIISDEGQVLAHVVIAVVSGEGGLLRTETPEILQSPTAVTFESPYRDFVASEFLGRSLLRSTGRDLLPGQEMRKDVYEMLVTTGNPYVWVDEEIGGKKYESVYILTGRENGKEKIFALSMESLDVRWHIFNLLKVIYFYLIVAVSVGGIYLLARAYQEKKFYLSFQGKLLTALLSLATVPLFVLAYYDRKFTDESRLEILRHQAEEELNVVESNLMNQLHDMPISMTRAASSAHFFHRVTDALCENIAQETGTDFNVYVGNVIQASSRPELFDAGLIDTRLNSVAYRNVVLEGRKFFLQSEWIGRYPLLVAYRRLDDRQGKPIGAISVFTGLKHRAVDLELFERSAFIFGAYSVIMVLVVSMAVLFAYRIGTPIRKLTDAMRQVSQGNLDLSVDVSSKDEIGEMVAAFNKMTRDLKRFQKELAARERELAWREMAKQVAHEIKNPLTPMKLSIQHLRQAYKDRVKDFRSLLEDVSKAIEEQIDALTRIATEFSRYARMPERKYEDCELHALLTEAVRLFEGEKNIRFSIQLASEKPRVMADREELRRVFINILRNAVQAIDVEGEIRVSTTLRNGTVEIEIADTGRGIPDEVKNRLFEPNFSTKTEGMGLGLAISKQTILDLKGRIEIESEVGKGTRVFIFLPVSVA